MVYLPSGARIMSTNVSNVLGLVSSRIRSRSGAVRGGPGSGDRPEAPVRVPDLRHRQGRLHLKRRTLRGDAAIKWIMIFKITFCLRRAFIFTNINLAIFFLLKNGPFCLFSSFPHDTINACALGLEPRVAEWIAQTNPLSYGCTQTSVMCCYFLYIPFKSNPHDWWWFNKLAEMAFCKIFVFFLHRQSLSQVRLILARI